MKNIFLKNVGDLADNFYIIIEGSVLVMTPKTAEQLQEERNLKNKLSNPFRKKNLEFPVQPPSNILSPIVSPNGNNDLEELLNRSINNKSREEGEARTKEDEQKLSSAAQNGFKANNLKDKSSWAKAQNKVLNVLGNNSSQQQLSVPSSPQVQGNNSLNESESDVKGSAAFDIFDPHRTKKVFEKLMVADLKDGEENYFENSVFKYNILKTLKVGEGFGELALIRKKPRSATILCYENCVLGVLTKEEFKSILMDSQNLKMKKVLEFFAYEVFKGIASVSMENVLPITYLFEKVRLNPKQNVFGAGDYTHKVYVVKKGRVEVKELKIIYIYYTYI